MLHIHIVPKILGGEIILLILQIMKLEGEMAQGLMVNVAAPAVCLCDSRMEHMNSGPRSLNVSTVVSYFHDMKVMEINVKFLSKD